MINLTCILKARQLAVKKVKQNSQDRRCRLSWKKWKMTVQIDSKNTAVVQKVPPSPSLDQIKGIIAQFIEEKKGGLEKMKQTLIEMKEKLRESGSEVVSKEN